MSFTPNVTGRIFGLSFGVTSVATVNTSIEAGVFPDTETCLNSCHLRNAYSANNTMALPVINPSALPIIVLCEITRIDAGIPMSNTINVADIQP